MTISIRLEPELEARINNLAQQTNHSKSFECYLKNMYRQLALLILDIPAI